MEPERVGDESFAWTDRQRAVIDLPVDAKALVVADAGTGKTAVLVQRLTRLVNEEGLAAGSDLLVLSFTRAVVKEIRKRLQGSSGWAAMVAPRTFDSFATAILHRVDPGGLWLDAGFDGRIEAAANLIDDEEEAQEIVGSYSHIFIDEIQDLVGVRADLVGRVLEHATGGFTLLGDPAQSIYDYQSATPGPTMFEAVRAWSDSGLVELSLDMNHRAETTLTRRVIEVGRPLSGPNPDHRAIGKQLLDLAAGLDRLGTPSAAAGVLRHVRGSTAILTRDNGHALLLSEELWNEEVDHRLQRSASDRAVAPWVARAFRSATNQVTSKSAVEERIAAEVPGAVDPEIGWQLLKQLDRGMGNRLDLRAAHTSIVRGSAPAELADRSESNLAVSTIHRAKGLEFDNVILLRTGNGLEDFLDCDDGRLVSEVRVLYVAMSRPRRELMQLSNGTTTYISRDTRTGRWIRRGRKQWMTHGFEVDVDDVDKSAPPGATLDGVDVTETQNYLWEEVQPGEPAELRFHSETIAGPVEVVYSVWHADRPIGITSPHFGALLQRRLHGTKRGRWPNRIHSLRIEGVETTAGPPAAGENNGLGVSGLWLRPRLIGLGDFEW